MILYALTCGEGHDFEAWFRDSAAYDKQAKRGLLSCPRCGTSKVEKQLMAPGVPVKANRKSAPAQPVFSPPPDPRAQMLMKVMRELRQHVEKTADYVGPNFAEEARKIHYNEAEKRGIYGEATAEDAKALIEEGIDVQPLPRLPEDGN